MLKSVFDTIGCAKTYISLSLWPIITLIYKLLKIFLYFSYETR